MYGITTTGKENNILCQMYLANREEGMMRCVNDRKTTCISEAMLPLLLTCYNTAKVRQG